MDADWCWPESIYGWVGIATCEFLFITQRNDCNAGRSEQEPARRLPSSSQPGTQTIPLPLGSHSTLWWPRVHNVTSGQGHCTGAHVAQKLLGKKGQQARAVTPSWARTNRGNWWLPSTQSLLSHSYGWGCSWGCSCYPTLCFYFNKGQGRAGC